ncbi:hypothetical protein IAE29_22700 [Ochrobactrum sp. S46]|nr:hypothetical protein [Ochrobactrum sp. S45]MBK0046145.1 hypothetical protein [Ochrobactrum sp. S46]
MNAEGEATVVKAIASVRERKGIAIVIAHRPSALGAVDLVLLLENGRQKAFGPRDEVLSKVVTPSPKPARQNDYSASGFSINSLQVIANTSANSSRGTQADLVKVAKTEDDLNVRK